MSFQIFFKVAETFTNTQLQYIFILAQKIQWYNGCAHASIHDHARFIPLLDKFYSTSSIDFSPQNMEAFQKMRKNEKLDDYSVSMDAIYNRGSRNNREGPRPVRWGWS